MPRGKKRYGYRWESFSCDDGYPATAPVGVFQPNRFGLHDLLGNVGEWVQDCYHENYQGAPVSGHESWQLPGDQECGRRVTRGGSWFDGPGALRSSYRGWNSPDYRIYVLGFRLAQDL